LGNIWYFTTNISKWDWEESFDYALEWFTKTYKEGDEYYYYAFGKLLEKSRRHDDGISTGEHSKINL